MQSYPKKLQDTLVFVLLILAGAGLATMLVKVWQLPVKDHFRGPVHLVRTL